GPNVRLTKGIYVEPPDVAFQDFQAIRVNYVRALHELLSIGSYVGIATHDDWLISRSFTLLGEHGRTRDEYEVQFLPGGREDLASALLADGARLRVYVPFGRQWYEYSLRRLQENPKMAATSPPTSLPGCFRGAAEPGQALPLAYVNMLTWWPEGTCRPHGR